MTASSTIGRCFPPSVFSALAQPRAHIPGRYGTQYGYGLYIEQDKGFPVLAHGGTIQGYTSAVVMAPGFKTGVVVMANRDGADTSGIADSLLAALLPVRFSGIVPPAVDGGSRFLQFAGKYANGASSLEIRTSEGKLTAKTGDEAVPLEAAGSDCFTGALTVCFADGLREHGRPSVSQAMTRRLLFSRCAGSAAAGQSTPAEHKLDLDSFEKVWTTIRDKHWEKNPGGLDWQKIHDEFRPESRTGANAR